MSDHLFLVAKITPKGEFYSKAREALMNILPATRNEAGCIQFHMHEGSGQEAGSFFLYEEWRNDAALELHYAQDYTKAVFEAYQEWLSAPPVISKMKRVGS